MNYQKIKNTINSICRCDNISKVLINGDVNNPCYKIIQSQNNDINKFQVPEPFSGKVDKAKIIFLTCNPSISDKENFPNIYSSENEYYELFYNRYDIKSNIRPGKIIDGKRVFHNDGQYVTNKTLSEVKSIADHILGYDSNPGEDYANIEIVHCKSKKIKPFIDENTVKECVNLHFSNLIKITKANVIVSCGVDSIYVLNNTFKLNAKMHDFLSSVNIFEHVKHFAFIGQPGSSDKRKKSDAINGVNLLKIRDLINAK